MGLFILLFIVVFCLYQEYITRFVFIDSSNYPPEKIIYICETNDDILKAIAIFEKKTGISFSQKYISVMILYNRLGRNDYERMESYVLDGN